MTTSRDGGGRDSRIPPASGSPGGPGRGNSPAKCRPCSLQLTLPSPKTRNAPSNERCNHGGTSPPAVRTLDVARVWLPVTPTTKRRTTHETTKLHTLLQNNAYDVSPASLPQQFKIYQPKTPKTPQASTGQKMEIIINRKGKEVRVFLNEGDTVSDLKRSIAAAIGTTPDKVKISPKNQMLSNVSDTSTLAETRNELRQVQDKLTKSATKIQASFRGHQGRKKVETLKRKRGGFVKFLTNVVKLAALGGAAYGSYQASEKLKSKEVEKPIPKGFFGKYGQCKKEAKNVMGCVREYEALEKAKKVAAKVSKK